MEEKRPTNKKAFLDVSIGKYCQREMFDYQILLYIYSFSTFLAFHYTSGFIDHLCIIILTHSSIWNTLFKEWDNRFLNYQFNYNVLYVVSESIVVFKYYDNYGFFDISTSLRVESIISHQFQYRLYQSLVWLIINVLK